MRPDHAMPSAWEEYGARWGDDELLYLPMWRRGFTPHELGALFFSSQLARSLERDVKRLTAELERSSIELENARRLAWWYRRQLVCESQLGLALARVDGRPAV